MRTFITLIIFAQVAGLRAQMSVTTQAQSGNTASYYVNNVLLGTGVTAFNVSFTGDSMQIGEFTLSNSGISISNGLILSTGNCLTAIGPNTAPGAGSATVTNFHDPDLQLLSGVNSNDGAILEFDFVPQGDSVRFNYVFASEEYEEFVCATVNDAFGFFLSGPGISGAFSNAAVNLAIIPGTNVPVSINTVNPGVPGSFGSENNCLALDSNYSSNSIYYIGNQNDSTTQYDGYTVVLEARYAVNCGDTYHIRLALGDGGDQVYDSGVFLEAGSFTSRIIDVGINSVNGDTTITEGCGSIEIVFSRSDVCLPAAVGLSYSGVATNGVDFALLPDSVFLNAGQSDTSIFITPYYDGINEGPEPFTIVATRISSANDTFTSAGTFVILDSSNLLVDIFPDTVLMCKPDSLLLYARVLLGGPPPYSYQWSNGQTGDTIVYYPPNVAATETLIVEISDSCALSTVRDTIVISGMYQPDPQLTILGDTVISCKGDTAWFVAQVQNGSGPFQYTWHDGSAQDSFRLVATGDSSLVWVKVTDSCGRSDSTGLLVTIAQVKDFGLEMPDSISYCKGVDYYADPIVKGGIAPYSFTWDQTTYSDSAGILIHIGADTTIRITAIDACGRSATHATVIDAVKTEVLTAALPDVEVDCSGSEIYFSPLVSGGLQPYTYSWNNGSADSAIHIIISTAQFVSVTVSDVCRQNAVASSVVDLSSYTNLEAELQVANQYCYGDVIDMKLMVSGGAGAYEVNWHVLEPLLDHEWFEETDSVEAKAVFYGNHHVSFDLTDRCGNKLSDTLFFNPTPCIFIPNVITPNGDGLNDAFYIDHVEAYGDAHLVVYNRWGAKVYEARPYRNAWVPHDQPEGTYFYILKGKYLGEYRGEVTVIKD
ncbi:MAG: hypothetical protein Kow0075_09120 [Salibacteraceae bacterium]